MIRHAIKNVKPKFTGKCYRYVKRALAASPPGTKGKGLTAGPDGDIAALNASVTLKKYGFINLLDKAPYTKLLRENPASGPIGAIYIYASGIPCKGTKVFIKDCGHIEIKTGLTDKNAFVSDFPSDMPISEKEQNKKRKRKYKLVSVMIKEDIN